MQMTSDQLRDYRGWYTQKQFAERLNIPLRTYQRIECKDKPITGPIVLLAKIKRWKK